MHTATGLWMTHHGLKRLQREQADLQDWLGHIKLSIQRAMADHKKDKEIELILFEKETVANRLKRVDAVLHQASVLPSVWSHKTEARAGDTVYLRHKDTIRALTLAAAWNADPTSGRVSVTSPLGQALVGRYQGNKVRLSTIDGELEYKIIKIV
ncbi:MAG: GreA/GreB family elongation factor [Patescibacteria group bacterium]|mgnify:CR=1 FL=1